MCYCNYCLSCFWSCYFDGVFGDRVVGCVGVMELIGISVRLDGEWLFVHRCVDCVVVCLNWIVGDDNFFMLMQFVVCLFVKLLFLLERLRFV